MWGRFFGSIFDFFQNLTQTVLGWLGSFFGYLFEKLFAFLKFLFSPVLILIAIIFYFIYKVAETVLMLLKVLLGIGKLVFALLKGIMLTISGLTYQTPLPPNHGSWTPVFGEVVTGLNYFQLDKVAYVLLFLVWITTAVAAVKILTSRGGGQSE